MAPATAAATNQRPASFEDPLAWQAQAMAWAREMHAVCSRVALLSIRGTDATVFAAFGVSERAVGQVISLLDGGPLRWCVEAASPVVVAGTTPGVAALPAALGLASPRALGVIPLVHEGQMLGLAYVDHEQRPLPVGMVGEFFTRCGRFLATPGVVSASSGPGAERPIEIPPNETTALAASAAAGTARRRWREHRVRLPGLSSSTPAPAGAASPSVDAAADTAARGGEPPSFGPADASADEAATEAPLGPACAHASDDDVLHLADAEFAQEAGASSASDDLSFVAEADVHELGADVSPRVPQPDSAPMGHEPSYAGNTPAAAAAADAEWAAWSGDTQPDDGRHGAFHQATGTADAFGAGSAAATADPEPRPSPFGAAYVTTTALAVVTPEGVLPDDQPPIGKWRRRVAWGVFALVGLVAVVGAVLLPFSPPRFEPQRRRMLQVPAGITVSQLADRLAADGTIRSPRAFRLLAKLSGAERRLHPGRFTVPAGDWAWLVLADLVQAQRATQVLAVEPGLTGRAIARQLEREGLVDTTSFMQTLRSRSLLDEHDIPGASAEGFLLPETYAFAQGLSTRAIVDSMLRTFAQRFDVLAAGASRLSAQARYNRVILASLVQAEAANESDMARVAGVFVNRLQRRMRLESRASVAFVVQKPKERLSRRDLRTPSVFNTFANRGLPPGPINNPGLPALRAALAPEKHDYYYFAPREDGSGKLDFWGLPGSKPGRSPDNS